LRGRKSEFELEEVIIYHSGISEGKNDQAGNVVIIQTEFKVEEVNTGPCLEWDLYGVALSPACTRISSPRDDKTQILYKAKGDIPCYHK
jgi:hypothetical protein